MKIFFIISMFTIGTFVFAGCTKFLATTPRATVSDAELFKDAIGFEQAMNGVYNKLGQQTLYGDNLTMGYLSALAKDYSITTASHKFYLTNEFDYSNSPYVSGIWGQAYNTIAVLNNILSQIDAMKSVFTADQYAFIKGEALGLRAYIHFDLFRLYAKNYQTNADAIAIPYRTEFGLTVEPPVSGREVVQRALADLDLAEELLADDPIRNVDGYRRYRFNYYAVLGLKARIYNYMGQSEQASRYAQAVIQAQKFPFVEEVALSTLNVGQKDRLFTPELVWALRVKNIKDWVAGTSGIPGYFRYTNQGSTSSSLTLPEAAYRELYEAHLYPFDYRFRYLYEVDDVVNNAGNLQYPSKYWQTWSPSGDQISSDRMDQTVPLIRITEMYYILANNTNSLEDALTYLNTVRQHRGVSDNLTTTAVSSKALLLDELTKEYKKEFYAEGQTFFWYKQIGATRMLFFGKDVIPENYILPIPETELEYNPNY